MSLLTSCFAYWKLDSFFIGSFTVTDETGNGFAADSNGVVQELGVGPAGSAMSIFNGTSKRYLLPNMSMMVTGHKATLNYWIKVTDIPTVVLKSGSTAFSSVGNPSHFPYFADNSVYEAFGSTTRKFVGPIDGANYQNLNMVTVTADEGLNEFKYYLNGVLKYQTTLGLWDWATNQTLGVGWGSIFLNGRMSHVGLFNRALTQTEITGLYNSGNGDFYPFASNIPDTIIKKSTKKSTMFNFTEEQIKQIVLETYGRNIIMIRPHTFTKLVTVNTIIDEANYCYFGKVIATAVGVAGSFSVKLSKTNSLMNGTVFYAEIPAVPQTVTTGTLDLENQLFNKISLDAIPSGCNFYFVGFKIQFG